VGGIGEVAVPLNFLYRDHIVEVLETGEKYVLGKHHNSLYFGANSSWTSLLALAHSYPLYITFV
jgi:hypothetical protein